MYTLSNAARAVQACRIESFSGQVACRMNDYRQSAGLPVSLPTMMAERDTLEIATAMGLFNDAHSNTYYSNITQYPTKRKTARLNIFDSGAGDSCLHPLCPYIVPASKFKYSCAHRQWHCGARVES